MTTDFETGEPKVLVFASQKGGSGKTTLSGHIAVAAELAGAGPVALVDADPQGSLAKWWNARKADTPAFAETSVPNLGRDIEMLKRSGIQLIVIDTPPSVTHQITEIIAHADLVVVPTRPSPHDIRAVGLTVDLIEAQQKQLVFVVNAATARARITSDTAVTLSQHGTVAPVTIHHRVDFAASMIDGRTVGEVNPNARSTREIETLWRYLDARLQRITGTVRPESAALEGRFAEELLTPMKAPEPVQQPVSQKTDPRFQMTYNGGVRPTRNQQPATPKYKTIDHPVETPAEFTAQINLGAPVLDRSDEEPRPWHGVERRYRDDGPPTGVEDRRRAPIFGRRTQH